MQTIKRDAFTARPAVPGDAPGILRVTQAAFASWPAMPIDVSPLEHLEWKMAAPGVEPGHHIVVTCAGDVVAVKLRWVGPLWVRGAPVLGDSGADLAVDPAYQGRGLGRLIVDFEEQAERPRGALGYDPPSRNEVARDHLSQTGKTPLPLRIWTRPLGLRSVIAAHRAAAGPLGTLRAFAAAAASRSRLARDEAITVDRLVQFDERIDALWVAAREAFDFARVRDAASLNWRFADRRSGRSIILAASEAGELLGYAVLRPQAGALNLGDLLVHPERPEAVTPLLRESVARARDAGAARLLAWLPAAHPYGPSLEAAGFVASRETVDNQFFEPRGYDGPSVLAEFADPTLRAHITMGDFDFV